MIIDLSDLSNHDDWIQLFGGVNLGKNRLARISQRTKQERVKVIRCL